MKQSKEELTEMKEEIPIYMRCVVCEGELKRSKDYPIGSIPIPVICTQCNQEQFITLSIFGEIGRDE